MPQKRKTVLVFGTFDGVHDGHHFFFHQARKQGDYLIAAIAQDAVVEKLKGTPPRQPLCERLAGLRASGLIDDAVPGDTALGSWSVVKTCKPNVIALGYDQTELEKELRAYIETENLPITLIRLSAHQPDTHHSSLLR